MEHVIKGNVINLRTRSRELRGRWSRLSPGRKIDREKVSRERKQVGFGLSELIVSGDY